MTTLKPIKIWGLSGPNPPKVAIIAAELGIEVDIVDWPISDVKKPEYVALNPNGRLPYMEDPNTGIKLWESGAIVEYLIEKYDGEHKISFEAGSSEYYLTKQWLFYQTTGQGPYFGQLAWFVKFHPEKIPGAIERSANEAKRLTKVLEDWLTTQQQIGQKGPWLVGDKMTYADLAFITWQLVIGMVVGKEMYDMADYPLVDAWIGRMIQREAVKKTLKNAGWGMPVYGEA